MADTAELLKRSHAGDKEARDRLVMENAGLVWSIVRRFIGRGPEPDDLFQIGNIGLIKAIDHFDTELGVRFSTYAVPMITGEIRRFLRDDGMIKVSRPLKELAGKVGAAREKLEADLGREPTVEELARSVGASREEVAASMEAGARVGSIYEPFDAGDESGGCLADKIAEKTSENDRVLDRIVLAELLSGLGEKEQQIIKMRYFENMTQQAIADRLSISRMRVIKLLDAARQSGVIQFRLRSDSVGMMQQSRELMQKYHLNDVFIIPEAEQEGQLNESIARAGAMYVADRLSESACINVGYGDTLSRTLNHLATMVQNPVTCISLTGGVSYYLPNGRSNIFNARLYLMPAPLLASSHEMAAAMRAEASVSEIIRMAALSSFTLVGIGAMHETATIVRSGIITQNELFRLKMSGAVGDVLCHFVDENGELIPSDIEDRLISTPLEKLRAMDNVVGLAAGAQKVEAIRAVLRGGYLDVLITDEPTAALLLKGE